VFLEGQTLNPADKDSVLTAVSHWIVELGELDATFKKADIAQLKAFVTKTSDKVRRPYARKDSSFPRRTVFAGTVNDFQFLHDITGNRRFWPIAVDAITLYPSLDYQQLWAEVKTWYDSGEKWYLSNQELDTLNQYSEQFMVNDPDIEALLSTYPFIGCTQWTDELMKNICRKAYIENPTKAQTMKLASAIRKYNGGQKPLNSNQGGRHFVPDLDAIKAVAATTQSSPPSAVVPVTPVAPVP
jgi:putative DNA primase/helicase